MLYVSIFIEALRSRPTAVVIFAIALQAALWTFVPTLFYPGPPGELAELLAVGHEFQFGSYLGPPLAFWLAEISFRLAGGHLFGVYLFSQLCVAVTFWSVYSLGSALVGRTHAAMAVLLMAGITVFTVPTPEFDLSILVMVIWALALLHYWRAVGEGRRRYWYVLAIDCGLLLLTTFAALVLICLLILFTLATERGRAIQAYVEPWVACVVAAAFMFAHLLLLEGTGDLLTPALARLFTNAAYENNFSTWLHMLPRLIAVHAGLAVLVVLASGWPRARPETVPAIERPPLDSFARQFVYFFTLMPALAITMVTTILGRPVPIVGAAPLLVLSGLAVLVAAGDAIRVYRQRITGFAWFGILVAPPIIAAVIVAVVPWTAIADLKVNQPVHAMGEFFGDSFQRRTGKPLSIVAGDPELATQIALGARSRPSVYYDATPQRSPWVTPEDIRKKGAIVFWPATDTPGTPPLGITQRFPNLVPEIPRAFARPVQGILPLKRVGWGVIRPAPTQ